MDAAWPRENGRLALLDWRRRMAALYDEVRQAWPHEPAAAHRRWRDGRVRLFADHPSSPLPAARRADTRAPVCWDYDPRWAWTATLDADVDAERFELATSTGAPMAFERIGRVRLPIGTLDVYWIDSYGGGVFLPFRDRTNGEATYGGGRYLLDTCKGADLGSDGDGTLVVDLNFAYHPSCVHDPRWTCPLPPPGGELDVAVTAGEQLPTPS